MRSPPERKPGSGRPTRVNRVEKVWAVPLQESKKRPEVYQHLSPDAVGDAYWGAIQDMGV
jgi:hypothetical protein